ncbi:FISUMP domain-containing protein [Bacteroides clarus]|uniref:FISUMP domain-containing protein n=1 Tax=Bacteroides clarus TaxID=626929 RepID=UPI0026654E21|nr:FISUMP domain-containing protein [Bacteroides clarus]
MKKYAFLLVALFTLWACSDDDTTPQQEVTCSITAPAEGTIIDLATATSMTIKGEGAVNVGEIESVTLKVNGKSVSEVTKVPFSYDYTFAADQAIGDMKIELTVKGDAGKEKTATANVTLKKTESGTDPEPEPEPEPEQEVTCEITTPTSGETFDLATVTELNITGKAAVNVGTVETFILKVGGVEIAPAPALAEDGTFSHTYALTDQLTGELSIELAVKGDKTATVKIASVAVTLTRTVAPPTAETFTDERDGHVYKYVTIGTQSWMAENLAYLPVINVPANDVPTYNQNPLYFVFEYEGADKAEAMQTSNYKEFGVLYNWYAAMGEANATGASADAVPSGVQGVCPAGWHLPSKAEWKILEEFVASELPDVKGEGYYSELDYEWVFKTDCKNVWSALAGIKGWGKSPNEDTHPDFINGPKDKYGLNIIPCGSSYSTEYTMTHSWWKESDSSILYWATDNQSYGGGTVQIDNLSYLPTYSRFGTDSRCGNSVRCVRDSQ